jgi:hypothetical protein
MTRPKRVLETGQRLAVFPVWKEKCLCLIPVVVILLSVLPLVSFLLPSTTDLLTESYEPGKTIRFFATHGTAIHKWGPVPNFLFGPIYGVYFLFLKLRGNLVRFDSHFPYGFRDPSQQIGAMILGARIGVLLIGLAAVYILARCLQKAVQEPFSPCFSVMLCASTSILLLESFVDTKPDGLMTSLLMIALGAYAIIVLRGPTPARALVLSGFWVASLSAKELTGATLGLPFLVLFVQTAMAWRQGNKQAGKCLLGLLAVIPFYLLFNVIYAPAAWWGRMTYVFGPLKDPAIWANVSQTEASYLLDILQAVISALGVGGILAFAMTIFGSFRFPSMKLLLLWLPFVSHLCLTAFSAGYMPAYFMLPLGPCLALPSAFVLAQFLQSRRKAPEHLPSLAVCTALICLWSGCSATVLFRDTHRETLERKWAVANVQANESISVATLVATKNDATALATSGVQVDRRPLFQLIQAPMAARPTFLLVPADVANWIQGIRLRPARAALLWQLTGFDYRQLGSLEQLGYRRVTNATPDLPVWCMPFLVAGSGRYLRTTLLVYRLQEPVAK